MLAVLLPFRMDFYRSMGYGFSSKIDEYRIKTEALPPYNKDLYIRRLKLRALTPSDVPSMISCHDAVCDKNHGSIRKFSEERTLMAEDETSRRLGCFDGERMVGYITYGVHADNETNYTLNTLEVSEAVYEDGQVLRALLGFIRDQSDLAQTVVIRSGEEDFYHLLIDPADKSGYYINYGFIQTNVSALGNMYKILDPETFIKNTDYVRFPEGELTVGFMFRDALTDEELRVMIRFEGGSWSIADPRGNADISIACSQADFSSILVGSASLSSLVRLGAVEIKTADPSSAARLSAMLRPEQRPFSNNDY